MAELGYWTMAIGDDHDLVDVIDTDENITDWTVVLYVMKNFGEDAIFSKEGVCDNDDDGEKTATFSIDDTDTEDLETGKYAWSVYRTDAGAETLLSKGFLTLTPPVRPTVPSP